MLTLVPTPIGNLEDITLRALKVLREADIIACEDTRTSSVLLRRYDISAKLVPFHLFNENKMLPRLIEDLRGGKNIAVISDAGTPGISDPGWILLKAAADEGLDCDVLPGPSAVLPALLLSGFRPHPFVFYGFLPEKRGERASLFATLSALPWTSCFYISPHKAARQLREMADSLGSRRAAIVREISKIHQEALRGTLGELADAAEAGIKGELVLVVEGADCTAEQDDWHDEADGMIAAGESLKTIVARITERFGAAKNEVKEYVLAALRDDEAD